MNSLVIRQNHAKALQGMYNALHIFYWLSVCSFSGFAAIFLSHQGLSNTQIGTATGLASLMTIFVSPVLSSITSKSTWSLQKFLQAAMIGSSLLYLLIAFVPVPTILVIALYGVAVAGMLAMVPLLSQMSMSYIEQGKKVNFGLARGLGSISYATAAVVLTWLAAHLSPLVLSVVYALAGVCFLLLLGRTPAVHAPRERSTSPSPAAASASAKNHSHSASSVLLRYPRLLGILVGFALMFSASTALSTYLIHLIHNHGGSDSLYGIAIFCMAASELPFMAAAPKLIRKFGPLPLLAAAGLMYLFRNAGMVLAPSLPFMLLAMMLQGASYGIITAVITYYIQDSLEEQDKVMGQTLVGVMSTGIGSTLGNVAGGILIDHFGMQALFAVIVTVTVMGSAIMMVSALAGTSRKAKAKPRLLQNA